MRTVFAPPSRRMFSADSAWPEIESPEEVVAVLAFANCVPSSSRGSLTAEVEKTRNSCTQMFCSRGTS